MERAILFCAEILGASFCAGILGSLLGIGGGLLLIPFLTLIMGIKLHYAVGASLVSVIATSSAAGAAFLRERLLNLRLGLFLNTATAGGALVGALIAGLLPESVLYIVFGLVLLYSAYTMFRTRNLELPPEPDEPPDADPLRLHGSYYDAALERQVPYQVQRLKSAMAGMFGAGILSGMLGIGAGAFKVLVMDTMMRLPIKVSTSTSNFMLGVTAAASAGLYFSRGDIHPVVAAPLVLGILAGATLGARLLHVVSGTLLRRIFVVVLLVSGVQMIWKGLEGQVKAADTYAVRVVRDLPYLKDANYADNKDKLDLYIPEGRRDAPVIVSYHGGALMEGDKSRQEFVGRRFASAGIIAAVVNYRLSPGVSHPAHIQDAAASFAWVKRHISEYGGNADRVFIIGHSAGAYLVALLATDARYLAPHRLLPRDIRGVVPVSAFYWVERKGVAPDRDKSVWGTDPKVWEDASPAHHLPGKLPPMLILYADGDEEWRRQQNTEFAQAVKAPIAMISNRTHSTIWSWLRYDGDEVAERIIKFVSGKD